MEILEKIVILKLNDKKKIPTIPASMQDEKVNPLQSEFRPNSRDMIRGFSPEVERIVLPDILGVQANEPTFASKAKDFWAEFSVAPTKEGLRLNIATEKKKNGTTTIKDEEGKDKVVDNMIDFPVVPEDYMVWQIAKQSSKVAKTEIERSNLKRFDFYLVDVEEETKAENTEFANAENAMKSYSNLTADSALETNLEKIEWVLELLRDKGEAIDVESLSTVEKKKRLFKLSKDEPLKFVSTVEDKNLGTKAKIVKLHNAGIISKEGKEYFDGETNIGEGKTAVAWFTKPENSQKVVALEARLRAIKESKRTT